MSFDDLFHLQRAHLNYFHISLQIKKGYRVGTNE